MSDITRVLSAIDQGDPLASAQFLSVVYDELRRLAAAKMAQAKPGQTFQATVLVHEAYLRLLAGSRRSQSWDKRGHLFAAAGEATRRISLEKARKKRRLAAGEP
jgi:hypothetical protein